MTGLLLVAILGAGLALFLESIWAIGARPRLVHLVLAFVSFAGFTVLAVESWLGYRHCELVLASSRRYDLDATTPGKQSIRIDAFPGVRSIWVRAERNDGLREELDLDQCQWRAWENGRSIDMTHGELTIYWSEGFGTGDRTSLDVFYLVDEATKPLLRDIHLKVTPSMSHIKDSYVFKDINLLFAWLFGAASLLGLAGTISQAVRWRARRSSRSSLPESSIANRESPGPAGAKG